MRRLPIAALSLCLTFASGLFYSNVDASAPSVQVDEAATRMSLKDGAVEISLAVNNKSGRPLGARINLKLLTPAGNIWAGTQIDRILKQGETAIICNIENPSSPLSDDDKAKVLWWRLRYSIVSLNPPGPSGLTSGVISVSEITPDFFDLAVIASPMALPGRYHARVRATHPVTSLPIGGVNIDARIRPAEEATNSTAARLNLTSIGTAQTNKEGYAVVELDLPNNLNTNGATLEVVGSRNSITQRVEMGLSRDNAARITLTTDKLIYQPEQTIHIRALVQQPSKRALPATKIKLKIEDEDDTLVYAAELITTRFGIAAADWAIPTNARLGDYEVIAQMAGSGEDSEYRYRCRVKVSRYELPVFTVSVKPDRGYYLEGQNAEVEVRADYLFGRPVTSGHVRIVRETSREWNYREQKWEIEESTAYEGELDRTARFIARIELDKDYRQFRSRDYYQYEDIEFAAYVTEASTGLTEQRRFDLRLSKAPIHIYVIDDSASGGRAGSDFYVSTCYADGQPALCRVSVSDASLPDRIIQTVDTNRYGLARVVGLTGASPSRELHLELVARDSHQNEGRKTHTIWQRETPGIRITTAKSIYRDGEPVEIEIETEPPTASVFVDVVRGLVVLRSLESKLKDGKGSFVVPYSAELRDRVTLIAYRMDGAEKFEIAQRNVIYPRDHELKLAAVPGRSQYRPGENATIELEIRQADGRPAEGVIGLSVVDQAVEERVRTDSDFGSEKDFWRGYDRLWGREESIAGITRASLDKIDASKPIPPDLDMVAAVLLVRDNYWLECRNAAYWHGLSTLFSMVTERQMRPIRAALDSRYLHIRQYPRTPHELSREMSDFGIAFDQMRDPWGTRYYSAFSIDQEYDVLEIMSAGPDKRTNSPDDFVVLRERWAYFKPVGERIVSTIADYHRRTGKYIRDVAVLKQELRRGGVDFDSLRDRWRQPYRLDFLVRETKYVIEVNSGGDNARFDLGQVQNRDDFIVWSSSIDYTTELQSSLNSAIGSYFEINRKIPQSESELSDALARGGIGQELLQDPWGQRYYAVFGVDHRYADRVRIYSEARMGQLPHKKTDITPVTQELCFIYLRSAGPDRVTGTSDDFEVARISRVVSETDAQGAVTKPEAQAPPSSGATGTIRGIVTDVAGAVISRVKVTARDETGTLTTTTTIDDGTYSLLNVRVGRYEMGFEAAGFKSLTYVDVPVQSSNITEIDAVLEAGGVTETVTVTAENAQLQTERAEVSDSVDTRRPLGTNPLARSGNALQAISTPRLREYFPETLLWQPSLETDVNGHAQVSFTLADNITTWKLSAIASTEVGEVGAAEASILAFQPFFVEHDPPRVLTEGDQIALPVVARNYLDKPQSVELEISPSSWFKLSGPARKRLDVRSGESASAVFDLEVIRSIQNGKQKISAFASDTGDAIEKPITVHPDGEEFVRTTTKIVDDDGVIEDGIPANTIDGTASAELKIYPNLLAHVLEGIEGIMQRPYGCAEQTISAAYPSLLLLRRPAVRDASPELFAKAERYVRMGYEKLVNNRGADGAFSYWGRGTGDPALTAYALRFLRHAGEVVPVDEDAIDEAESWLIKQQRPDGRWAVYDWWGHEDRRRTALLTAYVARVLAAGSEKDGADTSSTGHYPASKSLRLALAYLSARVEEIDEPYLIASYALAAADARDLIASGNAAAKLRKLAREEKQSSYWSLETNTPFYGWGLAGRVETTALAVQALALDDANKSRSPLDDELVNRGLVFLLRNKDRYGVWYSTQATVNVLDAMLSLVDKTTTSNNADIHAEVIVNGKHASSIVMPAPGKLAGPLTADLSQFFSTGINRVEIRRPVGSPRATVQLVTNHWEPWRTGYKTAVPSELRFSVGFDKTEAKIGEDVTCVVYAERIGFVGYGMLLAEIGLPPGADVDRASLERAMKGTESALQQYDVLPDRLIVYLWPRAGGSRFEFKFKPRFGMVAQTAPALLYDYYNPESRVVAPPVRFLVR